MNILFNGNKLFYEKLGDKKAGTIIFLHGWLSSRKIFDFVKNTKLREDFELIFLDFLGAGKSSMPFGSEFYTIESFAEQLEFVAKELKVENPILVAHSIGSVVALNYARKHETEKVVLICPPLKADSLNWALLFLGNIGISKRLRSTAKILNETNFVEEISKLKTKIYVLFGKWDSIVKLKPEELKKCRNVQLVRFEGGHLPMIFDAKKFGEVLEAMVRL